MLLKDSYDVVIIGAGPAGSATAKTCARRGLSVALLEKRQEIGAPKRCGEGLSTQMLSDMKLNIPQNCITQDIDGCIVVAPNGERALIDFGKVAGHVVERKMFDKWLAAEASRAGAYVQAKTEVINLLKENGKVSGVRCRYEGEEFDIKAKVVVGADGVETKIGRMAGLNTTNKLINVDSGFQFEMSNIEIEDPKKIWLFFGTKIAPRGYVWIFPKGNDVGNVGVGVGMTDKPARYYLENFVKEYPGLRRGSILEVNSGGIPVGGFLQNMVLDNFAVVGDAAHQVNPIHGGGMKEGTVAGYILGDVINESIKKNDTSQYALSNYNKIWWERRGHALERVQKVREVTEKLSDDDFNLLSKSNLAGDDIMELAHGNRLSVLAKALMKNPKLLTLAKHLL
jgi:digeranylgeranylglycerophospholipid reductase